LGCALAESAFAGNLGIESDLTAAPVSGIFRDDFLLFSESQSRFIVSIRKKDLQAFKELFRSIPFGVLGKTRKDKRFIIKGMQGKIIIDISIEKLLEAWQAPFKIHFSG
jgi:phosphoribosylformylglycinamidine synthase